MKHISELRQDIVTGDWILVATGRAQRPDEFAQKARDGKPQPRRGCPFERLLATALLVYDHQGNNFRLTEKDKKYLQKSWWVQVVPNKYPAFGRGLCGVERKAGPYLWQDGVGFHDVVVMRDHYRPLGRLAAAELAVLLKAYRDRYLLLKDEDCIEYISIFHNHGRESGATISHPHSQIIATPVIPPDVSRSLRGSAEYSRKNSKCPHCVMLEFELRTKERLVHLNRDFAAFCPFVSRQAFEVRIFPRRHEPRFEKITESEIAALAQALQVSLAKLDRGLADPAYNFFIHTAPAAEVGKEKHYHWHVEIVPKTAIWAGFEIGTGIEISTIAPEKAAEFLRKIKI